VKVFTDAEDGLWVVPSPPGCLLAVWATDCVETEAALGHCDRWRKRDYCRAGALVRQTRHGERECEGKEEAGGRVATKGRQRP
jgi:hypothetical protein